MATEGFAGRSSATSDPGVERTRAVTGLLAVVAGDVAIAVAAVLGIVYTARGSAPAAQIAAILSSGFTAIGTMTTAYFGIKSISNTAASLAGPPTGSPAGGGTPAGGTPATPADGGTPATPAGGGTPATPADGGTPSTPDPTAPTAFSL
jgi:hypothetical protein